MTGADAGNAVRPAGEILPVQQYETDDLAEGEGDNRKIVAAQSQDGKAQQDAPEGCENSRERQANPEGPAEILRQQRKGIGADRVKGDIAEVEQARETDDDVQAPAEHHVSEDEDREIEQIAVRIKEKGNCDCEQQQSRAYEIADVIEPRLHRRRNQRAVTSEQAASEEQ
jgi:hypothetical protein